MEMTFKSELVNFLTLFEKYGNEFSELKQKFENLDLTENNVEMIVDDIEKNMNTMDNLFFFKKTSLSVIWKDLSEGDKVLCQDQLTKVLLAGKSSSFSDNFFNFNNLEECFKKANFSELLQDKQISSVMSKIFPSGFDFETYKPILSEIFDEVKSSEVCNKLLKRLESKDVQERINLFYQRVLQVFDQFLNELGITSLDNFNIEKLNPKLLQQLIKGKEKTLSSLQEDVKTLVDFIGINKEDVSKLIKKIFNKFEKFTSQNPIISSLFNGVLKQLGLGGAPKMRSEDKKVLKDKRRRKMRSAFRKQTRDKLRKNKKEE